MVTLLDSYCDGDPINVGVGEDLEVGELARLVADVIGYDGRITTDPSRPDGMPQKLLDSSRIAALGWRPHTTLRDGIARTYEWYVDSLEAKG